MFKQFHKTERTQNRIPNQLHVIVSSPDQLSNISNIYDGIAEIHEKQNVQKTAASASFKPFKQYSDFDCCTNCV